MRILFFDIDGTLIHSGGAGGAALRDAFCSEFDVDEPGDVAFSGRTDRAISSSFFALHDVEDTQENWLRLRDAYFRRLPEYLPRHHGRILPGVSNLLSETADRQDVALGLLTGNAREGARIKLEHFGLFHFFDFGGFGDCHGDRDLVAKDALAEAKARMDGQFAQSGVWVIGDTPLDIACGRAINARVLAVATGLHPRAELEAARPDLLVDDLSQTADLLEQLLG
jgi:phosphoglycolate phosphatase-like HAD superfamily hydrolase